MKVYISGAISSDPFYKRKFEKAQIGLEEAGYEVVNPAEKNIIGTYKDCIDATLELLMGCDAIYMLSDWYRSKGARMEHQYAKTTEMWIAYQ